MANAAIPCDFPALLATAEAHLFSTLVANVIYRNVVLAQFDGGGRLITPQLRVEFIQQFGKSNKFRGTLFWILVHLCELDQFLCCIYYVSYHVSSKLNVADAN